MAKKYQSSSPFTRLGQTTVGENTDNRVEKFTRADGTEVIEWKEIIYQDTGPIKRSPTYKAIWRGTYEGMVAFSDLLNAIIEDMEDPASKGSKLPIEMSRYDTRFVKNGGTHE